MKNEYTKNRAILSFSYQPVQLWSGNFVETTGVKPDLEISPKIDDLINRKDTVMTKALSLFKLGN